MVNWEKDMGWIITVIVVFSIGFIIMIIGWFQEERQRQERNKQFQHSIKSSRGVTTTRFPGTYLPSLRYFPRDALKSMRATEKQTRQGGSTLATGRGPLMSRL